MNLNDGNLILTQIAFGRVDKTDSPLFTEAIFKRMEKLPEGDCLDVRSYKRNRLSLS